MRNTDVLPIAARVIAKCGGDVKVAEILGLHRTTVYGWTLPKSRKGTGGIVPAVHQRTLRDLVPELSIKDFWDDEINAA